MNYKKDIEKLLFRLKEINIERETIEYDLDYSKNYIDQVLSKGGNKKFFLRLKKYADLKLQNATSENATLFEKDEKPKSKQYNSEDDVVNVVSDYKEKYLTALEEIRELQKKLLVEKEKKVEKELKPGIELKRQRS